MVHVGGEQQEPAMSHDNSTRTKKETKESSNSTKGRLIEAFRRLENFSDHGATFPTALQIEQ